MPSEQVRYVECPRDAWQGLPRVIPVDIKRSYLRTLLDAGFRWLDAGSFVSPRAVPQLADTEAVLADLSAPQDADVLCIVGNLRGFDRAAAADGVTSVGYPLSVNETFQQRNLGRSVADGWADVVELRDRCADTSLELVVYLSMGFGNPYGEPWSAADTAAAVERLAGLGVRRIAVADTVGTADAASVATVLEACGDRAVDLGLHLHARPDGWRPLVDAGLQQGVRWFEGALAGVGGCPFAGDALVGNLPTERVVPYLHQQGFATGIDARSIQDLANQATSIATQHAA